MTDHKTAANKNTYLSRSALAEKLGITLKELTQSMIESGWLLHNDKAEKGKDWQLTAKGEFEGGTYRESKKFGKYIVWPESVVSHPAISAIQYSRISASTIAKSHGLSAKIINRLLAEMAWLSPYAKGWKLTPLGQANGGLQETNQDTGAPYVLWERSLLENKVLKQQADAYKGSELQAETIAGEECFLSLDGRYIFSKAELLIANWLYVAGFHYAYRRHIYLSKTQSVLSDFYLPKYNVHLHFQAVDIAPSDLMQQLERQQLSKEYKITVIEITLEETKNIDQVLSKAFLQIGIAEE